jgi:hypothetical protein
VRFFFLGADVDLGFAVDRICFLSHLVFCSASCASSELPKVKSTPESPSLLWISSLRSFLFRCDEDIFLFRCGAVVVRLFLSRCVWLFCLRCGCSCFDSARLFLFRCSAVFIVVDDDVVGEFRKTRHPRNVKLNKVLKACFSGARNSRFSEAWNL